MPAPTLLQTLLNRPTQTYSTPRRARGGDGDGDGAGAGARVGPHGRHPAPSRDTYTPHAASSSFSHRAPSPARAPLPSYAPPVAVAAVVARPSRSTAPAADPTAAVVVGEDDEDVFYTPRTTPSPPRTATPLPPLKDADMAPVVAIAGPSKRAYSSLSSTSTSTSRDVDEFSDYSWARSLSSATSRSLLPDDKPQSPSPRAMPDALAFPTAHPAWAKDVLWLGPPPSYARAAPTRARPRPRTMSRQQRPRMSALVEDDEEDSVDVIALDGPGIRRSRSHSSPVPRSLSAASVRVVDLPTTPATSAGAAAQSGYTSLVLPLAAYTPAKNPAQSLVSNKLDLSRSGVAQTTMSTISVTQHGAVSRGKRLSLHGLFNNSSSLSLPDHLRDSSPSPLAFTSRLPPPSRIGPSQVLVQAWAVALDRLDALIVSERASKADGSGFGFIPGRAFVGRVVESGSDVSNIARGDWVYGSLDVRKCGALSEFIPVDRRRVHHIPQILQPPTQPRTWRGKTTPGSPPQLTLEQIAFLALAGLPAHRVVRALSSTIAATQYEHESDGSKRVPRALVLQAHDGVGTLVTQELASRNVYVIAQVPNLRGLKQEEAFDHVAVAKAAGASHVFVGDPEDVLEEVRDMIASGLSWNVDGPGLGEFDCVVDTVGGKAIWNSAINVMREGGQFVTTVGDARDSAGSSFTAGAHFKHNMRTLHRAFTQTTTTTSPSTSPYSGARTPISSSGSSRRTSTSTRTTPSPTFSSRMRAESPVALEIPDTIRSTKAKKVKKRLGYLVVSPASVADNDGDDVRDTLGHVARLAQAGVLRPSVLSGWIPPGTRARPGSMVVEDGSMGLPRAVVNGPKAGAFKIVPFERTPEVLRLGPGHSTPVDLDGGGVVVIRVMQ